jgi:cell division protein FtsB
MAKTKKSIKSKLVGLLYLIVFVIIITFLVINDKGVLKYLEVKERVDRLEKEIDTSEQRINKINLELDSLKTNLFKIEKTAREKYNMKHPLEKGLDVKVKNNDR